MRRIGRQGNERPLAWLPLLAYGVFGVIVMVAVVLLFQLLGAPSGSWIPFAIGGAIVGGFIGVIYPWIYDRVGPERRKSQ